MKLHYCLSLIFISFLYTCSKDAGQVNIQNGINDPQVKYAIRQFQSESTLHALKVNRSAQNWSISTAWDSSFGSEAYRIRTAGDEIRVTGGDGVGLMYGLLHAKEQFEQGKAKIADMKESPRFPLEKDKAACA